MLDSQQQMKELIPHSVAVEVSRGVSLLSNYQWMGDPYIGLVSFVRQLGPASKDLTQALLSRYSDVTQFSWEESHRNIMTFFMSDELLKNVFLKKNMKHGRFIKDTTELEKTMRDLTFCTNPDELIAMYPQIDALNYHYLPLLARVNQIRVQDCTETLEYFLVSSIRYNVHLSNYSPDEVEEHCEHVSRFTGALKKFFDHATKVIPQNTTRFEHLLEYTRTVVQVDPCIVSAPS